MWSLGDPHSAKRYHSAVSRAGIGLEIEEHVRRRLAAISIRACLLVEQTVSVHVLRRAAATGSSSAIRKCRKGTRSRRQRRTPRSVIRSTSSSTRESDIWLQTGWRHRDRQTVDRSASSIDRSRRTWRSLTGSYGKRYGDLGRIARPCRGLAGRLLAMGLKKALPSHLERYRRCRQIYKQTMVT